MHWRRPFRYKSIDSLRKVWDKTNVSGWIFIFSAFLSLLSIITTHKSGQVSQFEDESGDGKAGEPCHSNNVTHSLSRSPTEPALAVPCLHAKLLFLFHCYYAERSGGTVHNGHWDRLIPSWDGPQRRHCRTERNGADLMKSYTGFVC